MANAKYETKESEWKVKYTPSPINKMKDDDIMRAKKAFFDMDRDFSGYIDKEELMMMMRSLGQNPSEGELDEILEEAEGGASGGDGDGKINLREFLHWYAIKLQQKDDTTRDDVNDTFKSLGGSSDEGMPKDALKKMLMDEYELDIDVDEIFHSSNANAFISQSEFESMMMPEAQ